MSKKGRKHQGSSSQRGNRGYQGSQGQGGQGSQDGQGYQGGQNYQNYQSYQQGGQGAGPAYGAPSQTAIGGANAPNILGTHQWLSNLPNSFRGTNSTQFLLGAVVGGALAWTLSSEERRNKILKSAVGLYSNVVGGVEEVMEQVSDLRAEVDLENRSE